MRESLHLSRLNEADPIIIWGELKDRHNTLRCVRKKKYTS